MNEIFMIEILDYQDAPPSVSGRFWWSAEHGLTCDPLWMLKLLQKEGILMPNLRVVYPSDGRVFFEALPFRFTGLERALPAIIVDQQGGESL